MIKFSSSLIRRATSSLQRIYLSRSISTAPATATRRIISLSPCSSLLLRRVETSFFFCGVDWKMGFSTGSERVEESEEGEENKDKEVYSDDKLVDCIEDEITDAVADAGVDEAIKIPEDFPFEIEDKSGDRVIYLKRKFKNENITIEAHMDTGEVDDDDEEEDEQEKDEGISGGGLGMIVTVDKGDGPTLGISCQSAINGETIHIDAMWLKESGDPMKSYQGPGFTELDETLQEAIYGYLEKRGINLELAGFLQDYLFNKDNKEYINWLSNMKNFVRN